MLYLSLENIIKHKVYILYLRNTDIFIHKIYYKYILYYEW